MTAGGKISKLGVNLRAAADAALKRLASLRRPAAAVPEPGPSFFAPPDPTVGLFGAADAREESAGAPPLRMQLEISAERMVERAARLKADSKGLAARIAERAEAEATLAVQAVRVLIAAAWLAAAAWLYNGALVAASNNFATLQSGMPVADALVLSRMFLIVAAAGFGVAFAVAAVVNLIGKGGNAQVRRAADGLGNAIADASLEFDDALKDARERMNKHAAPADAVNDLSRAHITALEAQDFFRRMPFLTGPDGGDAAARFRDFLRSASASTPPPPAAVFLLGAILGGLAGAALVYVGLAPGVEIAGPEAAAGAVAQYPWAIALLLFGGLAYAGAGFALSPVSGAVAARAAATARAEALDALRGAFASRGAPRPGDIAERVQDAVEIFKARVGGRGVARSDGDANHGSGGGGAFTGAGEDPASWRRRDSSVKFVETGFGAAPARWRTDAYEKKLHREPDAKRGQPGRKNDPGA